MPSAETILTASKGTTDAGGEEETNEGKNANIEPTGDDGGDKPEDDATNGGKDEGDSGKDDQEGDSVSDDAADDDSKKDGPPETYELKLPESATIGEESLEALSKTARELGLTNEQAQKLVDSHNQIVTDFQAKQIETFQAKAKGWLDDVKKDKELGGANLKATTENTRRAVEKFGDEELMDELSATGYGNWPPLVRFCNRIGKAMAEDNFIPGNTQEDGAKEENAASIMYPKNKG